MSGNRLENLQTERFEISIRNSFGVASRPVAIGHVGLSVNFVLAEVAKGHAEPGRHRGVFEC